MTDEKPYRIDLSDSIKGTDRTNVHLRGYYGDDGENQGVLAISTVLDPGENYPECGRIIVGSPGRSPLIEGYIPNLRGFSCGPDAADRLADELRAAAAAARAAMEKGAMKLDLDDLERKAKASKRKAFGQRVMIPADNVLALIARLRELEALTLAESDALDNYVGENVDEREDLEAMQKRMRRILEKGTVLP